MKTVKITWRTIPQVDDWNQLHVALLRGGVDGVSVTVSAETFDLPEEISIAAEEGDLRIEDVDMTALRSCVKDGERRYPTRDEATIAAIALDLEEGGGGEVVVHRRDGRIEKVIDVPKEPHH